MRSTSTTAKTLAATIALFVLTIVCAPASLAAPSLDVSATTGLSDGQEVTLSGGGFAPGMSQIAAGQCIEGYTGPSHCNLQGGATFRNADANGSIGTFTIVVKEKFGAYDCTVDKCVIAAAPLPTAQDAATVAANQVIIPITFGAAAPAAPAAPIAVQPDAPTAGEDELPKTGAGDILPVAALAALALLVGGLGLGVGAKRLGGAA